jgi:hypothetical protein
MTPFWTGLFENLRGRGRNAALFFVVVPALVAVALVMRAIPEDTVHDYVRPVLFGVGLMCVFSFARVVQQTRAQARQRLGLTPLSEDERCKARARLVKPARANVALKNSLVPPG